MATKLISKAKLVSLMEENGFKAENINYEAYGRKVCAYIRMASFDARKALEVFLVRNGLKVDRYYYPGSAITEVQVSYFKAKGWDE